MLRWAWMRRGHIGTQNPHKLAEQLTNSECCIGCAPLLLATILLLLKLLVPSCKEQREKM